MRAATAPAVVAAGEEPKLVIAHRAVVKVFIDLPCHPELVRQSLFHTESVNPLDELQTPTDMVCPPVHEFQ